MTDSPREVLRRFHQAMLDISADDLADLYAVDGVHEFPFLSPRFPDRYEGREAVRVGYRAAWTNHPVRLTEIRPVFIFEATDPEVIVCNAVLDGTVRATQQPFVVGGLLVLRVRDGQIVHAYDYMDSLRVYHTLGRLPDLVASLGQELC